MANILVVEDNPSVAKYLAGAMREAGHEVAVAHDGPGGLGTVRERAFDLILLDVMLPGIDGFELCRAARAGMVRTPILLLTARDTLEDKVRGLDSGADDYLVKPFELEELLARTRALLRRQADPAALAVGDLTLDPRERTVTRGARRAHLSATEYALLELLMRNAGKVVSRSMILEHVWHYDFGGCDNVLDVYINYLRNKIDRGMPPRIRTVRGIGYCLDADETP